MLFGISDNMIIIVRFVRAWRPDKERLAVKSVPVSLRYFVYEGAVRCAGF